MVGEWLLAGLTFECKEAFSTGLLMSLWLLWPLPARHGHLSANTTPQSYSPIDSESVKSAMQSWPCHHVTVIKKIGFDGARLGIVNKRLRNMKLQLNCNTTPMGITTSGNSIYALYKIQCSCSVLWKGLNLRLPTDFWYLGRRGSQGPC